MVNNLSWQTDPQDYIGGALGSPVTITSGYRTPGHNAAVGGVPNSAHLLGEAFDFVPKGMDTKAAAQKLAQSGIPFDQIINEGDHVHVSFAPTNRHQVLNMDNSAQSQGGISDDQLLAALTGKAAGATSGGSVASPAGTQGEISDDQLIAALTQGAKPAKAAPTAAPSSQPGWLQSASAGVVQGGRDVLASLDPAAQWLEQHVGGTTLGGLLPTAAQAHANNLLARQKFEQQYGGNTAATIGRVGGEIAGSLPAMTAGGEVLAPIAEGISAAAPAVAPAVNFLSGAYRGGTLGTLASKGALGAVQGAGATALTSGASDQPLGQQLRQGAEFGGLLGAGAPAAAGLGAAAYNKLTGGGVPQAVGQLANEAVNKFGIPLRGSQISSSPFMRYLDSAVGKMPLSGMEGQNEAQREAFARAVAGTFGEDAPSLTPEVMSAARKRIGNVFNSVAAKTNIADAPSVLANLGQVVGEAAQALPEGEVAPLTKQIEAIGSVVDPQTKTISGEAYQALTRKDSPLDRAMNSSNPNIRYYAGQIRNVLDDGLEASAAPEDLAALKQARLQWKNMRTVQDLAAKGGIEGTISPQALLGAVKKSYKDMAYSGAGDIGKLAHIGNQFLKEQPSSGTAERAALYSLLGAGAETMGEALSNPDIILHRSALLGGLMGAGRVIGTGLKSRLYRDMLLRSAAGSPTLNQLMGRPGIGQVLGNAASAYGIPSTVIAGNQLLQNQPALAGHP